MSIIHGFYRQRPDVVEAYYFDGREVTANVIVKWAGSAKAFHNFLVDGWVIDLYESKGTIHVSKGDWVVKDANGKVSATTGDVFETTYELEEPVAEETDGD